MIEKTVHANLIDIVRVCGGQGLREAWMEAREIASIRRVMDWCQLHADELFIYPEEIPGTSGTRWTAELLYGAGECTAGDPLTALAGLADALPRHAPEPTTPAA